MNIAVSPKFFLIFLIILPFILFNCSSDNSSSDDHSDFCASPVPYEVLIVNNVSISNKNIKYLKIKFYQKERVKNDGFGIFTDLIPPYKFISKDFTSTANIPLGEKKKFWFELDFCPYTLSGNKTIGKPVHFIYEIYKEEKLFMKKNITVQGEYIYPEGTPYRNWLLNTTKLEVENDKYIEKIKYSPYSEKVIILNFSV